MNLAKIQFPDNHRSVVNRLIAACQSDERVEAAFLGGSYAKGTPDRYSDLDLFVVTSDAAYDAFLAARTTFIQKLGTPLFLEDFGLPHALFFIFADHSEGELWIGRASSFESLNEGAFAVLLDKSGILTNAILPPHKSDPIRQKETLRLKIAWFWHELSHFIKAMGRRQLWFAYGQIEAMRQICVVLARLHYNFADPYLGDEPYFKLDQFMDVRHLSPLAATYCAMEYTEMLAAARVLTRFYRDLAPTLAEAHNLTYQYALEEIMIGQLEALPVV